MWTHLMQILYALLCDNTANNLHPDQFGSHITVIGEKHKEFANTVTKNWLSVSFLFCEVCITRPPCWRRISNCQNDFCFFEFWACFLCSRMKAFSIQIIFIKYTVDIFTLDIILPSIRSPEYLGSHQIHVYDILQ